MLIFCLIIQFLSQGFLPEKDWQSLGEAGIYCASTNGISSISWNPANYYLNKNKGVSLELFSTQTRFVNERLLNKEIEDPYYLDTETKDKFFSSIEGDYYSYKNIFEKAVISVAYKNYSFTYKSKMYWDSKIPKDLYLLIFCGNVLSRFNLSGSKCSAHIIYEYGLNISFPSVKRIYSGVRVKYLRGKSYASVDSSFGFIESSWDSTINTSEFFFSFANGGNGAGIDFGISGQWGQNFYTGLCIENLYSIVNWTDSAVSVCEKLFWDTTSTDSSSFTSRLPFSVRMASSYEVGIIRLILASSFEKYWAFSSTVSFKLWKHISATGGGIYSLSSILPIIEIGVSPSEKFKLSLGYSIKKAMGPFPKYDNAAYSLYSLIRL